MYAVLLKMPMTVLLEHSPLAISLMAKTLIGEDTGKVKVFDSDDELAAWYSTRR